MTRGLVLPVRDLGRVALPSQREDAQLVDSLREVVLGRSIFPSVGGALLEPDEG